MKTSEMTITPQVASRFLKGNRDNRPLNSGLLSYYMSEIANGRWKLNGATIIISETGRVLDGQHRLNAIVKTNIPITSLVVEGMPEGVFDTIDRGRSRTVAQILGMDQIPNAASAASAGRWLVILCSEGRISHNTKISGPAIREALSCHPLTHHFCSRYVNEKNLKTLLLSACCAVFTLAAEKYGEEFPDNFLDLLGPGTGLSKGEPAYELRERLIQNKSRMAKLSHEIIVALTIKAMRAFVLNKKVGLLRWGKDEPMPEL